MKVRVTFDISPTEKEVLQKILGKKKGVLHDEYKDIIQQIIKDRLLALRLQQKPITESISSFRSEVKELA